MGLGVQQPGVPGLGGAFHVGFRNACRAVNCRETDRVVVGFRRFHLSPLTGSTQLLELGIQLLDSRSNLLRGPRRLAAGDEVPGGSERLAAVEAETIQQAVQLLPQRFPSLVELGLAARCLLRTLAGGIPGERVLGERLDLPGGRLNRFLGWGRLL